MPIISARPLLCVCVCVSPSQFVRLSGLRFGLEEMDAIFCFKQQQFNSLHTRMLGQWETNELPTARQRFAQSQLGEFSTSTCDAMRTQSQASGIHTLRRERERVVSSRLDWEIK